jgi:replicative DNA helicase
MILEKNIPPQDLDAEAAVIGACLIVSGTYERAADIITTHNMFHDKRNAEVWRAISSLSKDKMTVDLLTVRSWLTQQMRLDAAGGLMHIMELGGRVSSSANVEAHAYIVANAYFRRKLIEAGMKMQVAAVDETTNVNDLADKCRTWLDETQPRSKAKRRTLTDIAHDSIMDTMKAYKGEGGSAFKLGLPHTDEYRIAPGDMVVLAGRPGMGKTAAMMTMAKEWAKSVPVLMNLIDMGAASVASRDIASNHDLSGYRMMTGDGLNDEHFVKFSDYATKQYNNIDVCCVFTMDALEAEIAAVRKDRGMTEKDPMIVIVDYIQLMTGDGKSITEQTSLVSRAFKFMCKTRNIVGIALAQLSRSVENRTIKKPMLSDLRESGQIEQDTDMVMFLYRPEYYGIETYDDGSSTTGILEVLFAKTRMGSSGDEVKMGFVRGRVVPLHGEAYNPPPIIPLVGGSNDDSFTREINDFPF